MTSSSLKEVVSHFDDAALGRNSRRNAMPSFSPTSEYLGAHGESPPREAPACERVGLAGAWPPSVRPTERQQKRDAGVSLTLYKRSQKRIEHIRPSLTTPVVHTHPCLKLDHRHGKEDDRAARPGGADSSVGHALGDDPGSRGERRGSQGAATGSSSSRSVRRGNARSMMGGSLAFPTSV